MHRPLGDPGDRKGRPYTQWQGIIMKSGSVDTNTSFPPPRYGEGVRGWGWTLFDGGLASACRQDR